MPSYECRGKNKLWSVRFDIVENGRPITKRLSGFKTKRETQQAYISFINNYKAEQNYLIHNTNILERHFDEVFEEFKTYKQSKVKDSTFYELVQCYNKHILPYFGFLKIKQITKTMILKWQQSLEHYSYSHKTKLRLKLYSFYKYLHYYYDIENVVAKVEPFTEPTSQTEMLIWSLEEFNKFIKAINNDIIYKTFFTFLYYTGCRLGEVLALNYKDINFETKILSITKSVTSKIYKKESNLNYKVTSPKNSTSNRKILIPDILINQLYEYLKAIPEAKQSTFLFGLTKPLDDHTIYRRLETYCNLANVKKIRIHDFRHSHTSLLIANGANIVLVAKRLGHKNTQQTLNTYSHLFPNSEHELIDIINKL